ncbi:MAG: hypothetical protein KKH98_08755 [Spirochaetes bacterium]|nr:hypothetical protein [Spirochaetota bacterium]
MARKLILIALLVLMSAFFTSCTDSIFGWLYPGSGDAESANDLIALGDQALAKGDATAAYGYYVKAVTADASSGRARIGVARARFLMSNVDLILLVSKMTSGTDDDLPAIITQFAVAIRLTMDDVITYLAPITQGACPDVSMYDFEVNINLVLSYFLRGFIRNGDSNNDLVYFSAGGPNSGDLFIFQDGNLGYNTAKVDVENLESQITTTLDDFNNRISLLQPIEESSVSNIISFGHDIVEDLIEVYKIFGTSFSDFQEAANALNRGVQGISGGEVMDDVKNDINERVTEMSGYLTGADADALILSSDHLKLVGTNAFSGSYTAFAETPWATTVPTFATYAAGKTNLLRRVTDHPGSSYDITNPTNMAYIQEVVTVMNDIVIHITDSNLLKQLMGTGGS